MVGKIMKSNFFGYSLFSARMVIEWAFSRLKARFGCLNRNRNMDFNLKDLPNVIYACFVLHNFCKIHKELIYQSDVSNALKNDVQSQPQTRGNYTINDFVIHNIKYVKYVKYDSQMFQTSRKKMINRILFNTPILFFLESNIYLNPIRFSLKRETTENKRFLPKILLRTKIFKSPLF